MRLALGMMVHDDLDFLRLHLPAYAHCFDGIIIVVETRKETETLVRVLADIIPDFNSMVYIMERKFNNNWSEMFNHVLDYTEELGVDARAFEDQPFDAIVRLDPDEAIFPQDVTLIRDLLETYIILCFARYNFWGDRLHYTPGVYPDWQCRAWRLHRGIRLGGQHHEGVGWTQYGMFEGDPVADTPREVLRVPTINIYHYGNVGRERILERDLHYVNVEREKAGHPPLDTLPEGREFPTRHSISFHGQQPIHPRAFGVYAPGRK